MNVVGAQCIAPLRLYIYESNGIAICWQVSDALHKEVMNEFEAFYQEHYGLDKILSSNAKFEIEAYT